jgi:photosystem II protein PsbQ
MKVLAKRMVGITILLLCLMFLNVAGALAGLAADEGMAPQLQSLNDHVEQLHELVAQRDWFEIRSYIGGPMYLVRRELQDLSQELPRDQQQEARQISRRFTDSLVQLDQGAKRFESTQIDTAQSRLENSFQALKQLFQD